MFSDLPKWHARLLIVEPIVEGVDRPQQLACCCFSVVFRISNVCRGFIVFSLTSQNHLKKKFCLIFAALLADLAARLN